jgi:hypothetical protein
LETRTSGDTTLVSVLAVAWHHPALDSIRLGEQPISVYLGGSPSSSGGERDATRVKED